MKVMPIVAGAAALIAGTPAAHAERPLPARCSADVPAVSGSRVAGSRSVRVRCPAGVLSEPRRAPVGGELAGGELAGGELAGGELAGTELVPPGCAPAAPEDDPELVVPYVDALDDLVALPPGFLAPRFEPSSDCDGPTAGGLVTDGRSHAAQPGGGPGDALDSSGATRPEGMPRPPGGPLLARGDRSAVTQLGDRPSRPRSPGNPELPARDRSGCGSVRPGSSRVPAGSREISVRPPNAGSSRAYLVAGERRWSMAASECSAPRLKRTRPPTGISPGAPGAGSGRSAGLPHGLSPGASAEAGGSPMGPLSGHGMSGGAAAERRPPVLPRIVPGPSVSAPAGSKLTTLTPTEPLRAGRKSWAEMIGAAIAAEAALLWLVVGLALRRRVRPPGDAGTARRSRRKR
jgi:hypothetical protein